MDDTSLRKLIHAGDIVDRLLINEIKMDRFPAHESDLIKEENEILLEVIEEWSQDIDVKELNTYMSELKRVLVRQWDILDKVRDPNSTNEERGKFALEAQDINIQRVKWKNRINEICGSFIEFKHYGKD
tara:strand:- start:16 stop:402 length:387 start_codon:yes stop_codon:yes gene_type:complete